ncbi:MAG: hypothetical protein KAH56_01505 [Candidatus Krumholzibacteria bacterium]|nr:hypothetical protein [Candidatus Krumholzibacteria bacterium]
MEKDNLSEPNYWKILSAAEETLAKGDFAGSEYLFHDASGRRDRSPGRVFFSEKLTDGLKGLLNKTTHGDERESDSPGRWSRRTFDFRSRFLALGEKTVREGVRVAQLRPEDDPATNQPVLEAALFLVARSSIFQEEPSSAVPLLKGLFRTACRTARPFDFNLVRHDLPLTEEDRLWLAGKGGELFDVFIEQEVLVPGSAEAGEWARVVLQLLEPRYFGSAGRLEEERSWLEAVTADRLLGRAAASVELYRAYLGVGSISGARNDEARVRLLELMGNTDAEHFPVPRYDEAVSALSPDGLSPGSSLVSRWESARACIDYRRPLSGTNEDHSGAWASLALEPDGCVTIVFWWDDEPRDVAYWRQGENTGPLDEFLAPCRGRLVAYDEAVSPFVSTAWREAPASWTVREFMGAVMESRLPEHGLDQETLLGLCLAETGPWRTGWNPAAGHPELEPPRSSSLLETWEEGPAAGALVAGLSWLAVRNRVASGDPALRAGIGELARRGDPASMFIYGFITMDSHGDSGLDAAFQPWTLPLLWTRPDPFGWTTSGVSGRGEISKSSDHGIRLDLGRNDLAIVSTGEPTSVLAAWGDGSQRWRVVLDRLDRLESLAQVAQGVIGPVTLIPPAGTVHSLGAALEFLESLLTDVRPEQDALLPLFHWLRLVETHNGDLLDFRQVRPRPSGLFPLYDRYAEAIGFLNREEPRLDPEGHLDSWAGQFSQRVRKAGLVAGPVDHLAVTPDRLDSLWGVFEGSDVSWVFLDSAAIHWTLLRRGGVGIQEIHALLHSRGRRHLSLLTGAVWLPSELEALLGSWLGVFGNPYCLSLTDGRPPTLRLADKGIQPEARVLVSEALASQATWLDRAFVESGGGFIQLPVEGRAAAFWNSVSNGEVALAGRNWNFVPPVNDEPHESPRGGGMLAVPSLASLEIEAMPVARSDTRADWAKADSERSTFFSWRRQVCSLEIAAYLAGPWETVAILDTRWWRLLLKGIPSGSVTETVQSSPGAEAVRWATDQTGRVMDLPDSDPRGRYPVDGRILSLVNDWLATRPVDSPLVKPGARSGESPVMPAKGVNLLLGDESATLLEIMNRVAEAWERGRVEDWILLVADAAPGGAADLVAGAGMAGISIWAGGSDGQVPSPLIWVEPEDFGDPGLGAFLKVHPPTIVVAGDVADWMPGPDREAQETALALRMILDCGAETVLLHTSALTDSRVRFLVSACGANLMADGMENSTASALPTVPTIEGLCLDCGQARDATEVVRRLGALFPRLRDLSSPRVDGQDEPDALLPPPPGRQLLSLAWLGNLAGVAAADIAEGVRLLRWAARLAGDSLSSAGSERSVDPRQSKGHTLVIPRRFVDMEKALEQLEGNLGVMLPMWLGGGAPGNLNWVDLEYPPARIDDTELNLLDCFLMWNGSRDESGTDESPEAQSGLIYCCPRGLLHSTQRLVGCGLPFGEVMQDLAKRLRLFRSRIEEIMAGALETGEGFLVETGLTDLRPEEKSFLGLGAALGFWRWIGPPCHGAIHLVDLLTLADSRTVRDRSHGWELVRSEAVGRYPGFGPGNTGTRALEPSIAVSGRGLRGFRSLMAGGAEKRDDLDSVVARVADLAQGVDSASLLVLKGVFGSGRHEALGRGLLKAGQAAGNIPEITVYCPDEAVAAMVCREFLRLGLSGPLDVRVSHADPARSETPSARTSLADPSSALVVMCEAQRFDPETRYRIAQTGRGRRLLMTVDPVATLEPWEHLFLTTPRTSDIVDLPGQRRSARKLWSEVRRLVPSEYQNGSVQRRDKGVLISDYAANLDQCLSRVVHEHQAGKLMAPLRMTAPMPGDLEYLGSSIRDRGWLAVLETRLESLFLPGPREFLAAATDHLALGGHMDEVLGLPAGSDEKPDLLIPRLLGPGGVAAWKDWVAGRDFSADITLNEFAALMEPTNWANTFLARPAARTRILRFLEQYGEEPLSVLRTVPLWEAWWYMMLDDVTAKGPRYRRPLAVLTSAARPLGCAMPGMAYLCLGTEPVGQHYESLVRVTDSLLVLYQEKSPLPSEAPE